jgi:pterin-4a-carbinolamine dehydratase
MAYRDMGWEGVGDWLGTGVVATRDRAYRPFGEARAFARRLALKSATEWRAFCKTGKCPADIPTNPWITYRDRGWVSFGDWFGTGTIATYDRDYRPFRQARAFVRRLGLRSEAEWFAYLKSGKCPLDIPANPWVVYRDRGWVSRGDWFGTGSVSNRDRQFRPFHQARAFVRRLGLKSQPEWFAYCRSGRCPSDIPTNPHRNYRDRGWEGYGDWLGTGSVSNRDRKFRSFREARAFVRRLGLKSEGDWRAYSKSGTRPLDIPAAPGVVYRDTGWEGWANWLGTPGRRKGKNRMA